MPEEPQAPIQGQPQEPVVPKEEPQSQVPEKFKDKSPEEIVKAYDELSKTIGKQGEELGKTRKEKEELDKQINNLNKLVQIIESDPSLFAAVEAKIKGTPAQEAPVRDDVRESVTANVFKEFEKNFKIDILPDERAKDLRAKVGNEIMSLTGKKIEDIPLSDLPILLEKGYRLATMDDKEEQARLQGMIEARQNKEGEFGSIPSSGVNAQQKSLTPDEQRVARRLGISDEDYLKYK